MSFYKIVADSGTVGILTWLLVFMCSIAGMLLVFWALASAGRCDGHRYPLPLKLLAFCAGATLAAGASGTLCGYIDSFAILGATTGAEKAKMLEVCMWQAEVSLWFSAISAFVQLLGLAIAFMMAKTAAELEVGSSDIRKTGSERAKSLWFALAAALIVAIAGAMGALGSIYSIVTITPADLAADRHPFQLGKMFLTTTAVFAILGIALAAVLAAISVAHSLRGRSMAS